MYLENKKARHHYHMLNSIVAGIVLTGPEVKSIKESNVSFTDAHCVFIGNELYVRNLHISEYKNDKSQTHSVKRDRKLLLNRTELNKFQKKIKLTGLTIVPTHIYTQGNRSIIKLKIGLAKGKKLYDKRSSVSNKENEIKLNRIIKTNI